METISDSKRVKTEEIINKNNSLINKKYSKDSFERFGDDLCELLLSYIRFSDKLQYRYEMVSKQWFRLIYNKENNLMIVYLKDKFYLERHHWLHLIPKTQLKVFLNKFKFITNFSLMITYDSISFEPFIIIFEIISDYKCLKTIRFEIRDREIPYKIALNKFLINCGQRLTDIDIKQLTDQEMASVLTLTPNLRIIHFNWNIKAVIGQHLPQLTQISGFYSQDFLNGFKSFTDLYHKQIKKISIYLRGSADGFNAVITQLLRFERLEALVFNENVITDDMLKMLSQLKSLTKLSIVSKEMTTEGVLYVINSSSHKLSEIRVNKYLINEKTITAFVNKANKSPKIKYKFIASDIDEKTTLFKKIINNNTLNNNLFIKM